MSDYQKIIDLHNEIEVVDYDKIKRAAQETAPPTERYFDATHPVVPLSYDSVEEQGVGIRCLLRDRYSVRTYSEKKMSLKELSNILHYSGGIKAYRSNAYNIDRFPVNYSPSAGGLMSMNLYVVVSEVEGLDAGVYYYAPQEDALVQLFKGRPEVELADVYVTGFPQYAPVNVIMTGDIRRFFWKYDYRGYRLMNVDCGIMAENLTLTALEQGLGSCMLAAFSSEAVSRVLQLEPEELPLLCLSFGGMA